MLENVCEIMVFKGGISGEQVLQVLQKYKKNDVTVAWIIH